jgi:type 1 glutamine amidotransferase
MKSVAPAVVCLLLVSQLSMPGGQAVTLPTALEHQAAPTRKVVFVAGKRSHAYGSHDHWAGSVLLSRWLNENHPRIKAVVHRDGWPADPAIFDGAAAIVIYADGGAGHPVVGHLDQMAALMKRGVGLVLIHYAVEVEEGTAGPQFLEWAGGYFKIHHSVNPHWLPEPRSLPTHPVTRGVAPFQTHDEWYYHVQFRDRMAGVVPILTALPPESTLSRSDGPHQGNPAVRAAVLERKEPQHVAWATQRRDGGRAFGFTGGHWHWNWGHPMQRKLVLNAIAWVAKAEVPRSGIPTPRVTIEDLEANNEEEPTAVWLGDPPPPRRGGGRSAADVPTRAQTMLRLEQWQKDLPRVK